MIEQGSVPILLFLSLPISIALESWRFTYQKKYSFEIQNSTKFRPYKIVEQGESMPVQILPSVIINDHCDIVT